MRAIRSGRLLRTALAALTLSACGRAAGAPAPATGTGGGVGPSAEPAPALVAASGVQRADTCPATPGRLVLDLVNRHRREAGMGALEADGLLVDAALAHARDLADHAGLMGHVGSDGSEPTRRVERAGYTWVRVGENVAGGTPTPSTAVAGWMRSPDHRHNILTAAFEHAGVAYLDAPGSEWGTYWVMVYAAADRTSRRAPLRCHP